MTDVGKRFPEGSIADIVDTVLRIRENEKKINENNKKIEEIEEIDGSLSSQINDKKNVELINEANKQTMGYIITFNKELGQTKVAEDTETVIELFPRKFGLKKIEKNLSVFNNLLFDVSLHLTRQEHDSLRDIALCLEGMVKAMGKSDLSKIETLV